MLAGRPLSVQPRQVRIEGTLPWPEYVRPFAADDTAALQAAFDPAWESAVPYTVLLDADGKVLYKNLGTADILELRRTILANMPSDYIGFNKYWQTGSVQNEPGKGSGR